MWVPELGPPSPFSGWSPPEDGFSGSSRPRLPWDTHFPETGDAPSPPSHQLVLSSSPYGLRFFSAESTWSPKFRPTPNSPVPDVGAGGLAQPQPTVS